jgi:hypothetical protein
MIPRIFSVVGGIRLSLIERDQQRGIDNQPFEVPAEYPSDELIQRPSGTLCEYGLIVMFPGIRLQNIRSPGPISNYFIIDTCSDAAVEEKDATPGKPARIWQLTYSKDANDPA